MREDHTPSTLWHSTDHLYINILNSVEGLIMLNGIRFNVIRIAHQQTLITQWIISLYMCKEIMLITFLLQFRILHERAA